MVEPIEMPFGLQTHTSPRTMCIRCGTYGHCLVNTVQWYTTLVAMQAAAVCYCYCYCCYCYCERNQWSYWSIRQL